MILYEVLSHARAWDWLGPHAVQIQNSSVTLSSPKSWEREACGC